MHIAHCHFIWLIWMRYYARIKYAVAVIICAYGISAICMHIIGRDTKEIIEQSKEMNTHENKLISISDFLFFHSLKACARSLHRRFYIRIALWRAHCMLFIFKFTKWSKSVATIAGCCSCRCWSFIFTYFRFDHLKIYS